MLIPHNHHGLFIYTYTFRYDALPAEEKSEA